MLDVDYHLVLLLLRALYAAEAGAGLEVGGGGVWSVSCLWEGREEPVVGVVGGCDGAVGGGVEGGCCCWFWGGEGVVLERGSRVVDVVYTDGGVGVSGGCVVFVEGSLRGYELCWSAGWGHGSIDLLESLGSILQERRVAAGSIRGDGWLRQLGSWHCKVQWHERL